MIVQGYDNDHSNYWASGKIILPDRSLDLLKIKDKSSVDFRPATHLADFGWTGGHLTLSLSQSDSLFLLSNPKLHGTVELVTVDGGKYTFPDCKIKANNIDKYLVGFNVFFETTANVIMEAVSNYEMD